MALGRLSAARFTKLPAWLSRSADAPPSIRAYTGDHRPAIRSVIEEGKRRSSRGASTRGAVLISGGGIAGLTLAYWLHRQGLQPTVMERAPHVRPGGYAIDVGGSGWDVAERMNLISELRQGQVTAPYFSFKDGAGRTLSRLPTA
jgi:NADPH-dependent 2,4-dienoyl-CoA reductase/sulfur reductase-like enzyme